MRRPISTACQVTGCPVDLTTLRPYFLRQKICEEHSKAERIPDGRGGFVRFCQQCTKLEPVSAFEGTKRSCRASLIKRHDRHRMHASGKRGKRGGGGGGGGGGGRYGKDTESDTEEEEEEEEGTRGARRKRHRTSRPESPRGGSAERLLQQQLMAAAAAAGLGAGQHAGGRQMGGAGDEPGMELLLRRLGSAGGSAPDLTALLGTGRGGLVPPPPLPGSGSSDLETLFVNMQQESLRAASAAAAAGTAAQAILAVRGGRRAGDAQQLIQDIHLLQQLQRQMLQRLEEMVEEDARVSPPPALPPLPAMQPATSQPQVSVGHGGGGPPASQLELLLSLLPSHQQEAAAQQAQQERHAQQQYARQRQQQQQEQYAQQQRQQQHERHQQQLQQQQQMQQMQQMHEWQAHARAQQQPHRPQPVAHAHAAHAAIARAVPASSSADQLLPGDSANMQALELALRLMGGQQGDPPQGQGSGELHASLSLFPAVAAVQPPQDARLHDLLGQLGQLEGALAAASGPPSLPFPELGSGQPSSLPLPTPRVSSPLPQEQELDLQISLRQAQVGQGPLLPYHSRASASPQPRRHMPGMLPSSPEGSRL